MPSLINYLKPEAIKHSFIPVFKLGHVHYSK